MKGRYARRCAGELILKKLEFYAGPLRYAVLEAICLLLSFQIGVLRLLKRVIACSQNVFFI